MRRPIGYWRKLVDRLIDEISEGLLHEQQLARRHWQLLNGAAAACGRRHQR